MKTQAPDTLEMPPGWLAEVQAVADAEHRAPAELVRDVVGRYIEERQAQQRLAPKRKHTPAEAAARIRELSKGVRLPEGVTMKDLISYGRA